MNISSISINRPVLATVISIVIVVFGLVGFTYLGVREFPSVDPPIVTVTTNYPGANSDIMESQITEPLEESINGIAGITSLTSESTDGRSTIKVEFELGINMDNAANDVRDRVSRAIRNLPPNTDPPVIVKSDANAETILSITVSSDKRTLLQLTDIGINIFKERLQTIPGVSEIRIWGEKKYAMRLEMDPQKVAAYGLTPLDIKEALLAQNVELPSGRIEGYEKEMIIRTFGRLTTERDFNEMIISEKNGTLIRFKDIGSARLAPENERTLLRGNGRVPMIGVALTPQPGANYIDIVDEAYKRVDQIKKELPDDIRLGIALDTTTTIRKAIGEVEETILIAFGLVVLIIFVFLRNWRTTLIPVIAIPISLVGTFFIMYVAGFSINILTLLGIVLATGIVVDDAIVVMENIYSKVEKGMNPIEAAHKGSAEIFFAIVSTTITLCAVFLPIIFLEGLTGRLFREFGIVVAGAVAISGLVSLTLTPMMSSRMLKKTENPGKFYKVTERFFSGLNTRYGSSLQGFMRYRWLSFLVMIVSVGIAIGMWMLLPEEVAPMEDKSRIRISSTAPEGTSYEKMDAFNMEIAAFVDTLPEKESMIALTAPSFGSNTSVNTGMVRIVLVPPGEREKSQQEIADELRVAFRKFNFARVNVVEEQTISTGGGYNRPPVQFVLQAPALDSLRRVLPVFFEKAAASPVFQLVDYDLKFNKPELKLQINREKAREMGVEVRDIAETMQLFFSGQRFGFFILDGKQYQVIGQAMRESRNDIRDIAGVTVKNKNGELVRLDNLISIEEQSNPPTLFRYNRYVSATVMATPAKGYTIGDGIEEMRRIADEVLNESFATSLAGPSKDFGESSSSLLFAFGFAILLIFLALAAQFESFFDPFTILLTVPLALAGALLALFLFGHTLNIFSKIGIIVLIGIVTKNGILIVEFANQKKEEGLSVTNAAIEAAVQRFRPIVMTSLATVLGAVPIALALSSGATSRIPMGVAIIGGLLFSLGLTLYVIPALYTYMEQLSAFIRRIFRAGPVAHKGSFQPSASVKTIVILLLSFFAFSGSSQAQTLTFESAVQEMLAKNFDIQIVSNNQEIAQQLNNIGTAGFLPTVDAGVNYEKSFNNTQQIFFDGREQGADNAESSALTASVLLNWTLFDGFRMFATKNILEANETLSGYYLRAASEEAMLLLSNLYYQIVQRGKLLDVYKESLAISKERYELAVKRKEIGTGSQQEVLQALIDMNADSTQVMTEEAEIGNLKTELNLVLARDVAAAVETGDIIPLDTALTLQNMLASATSANVDLLIARENIRVALNEVKVAKSFLYPEAGVYAGFDYGRSKNEVGVLQSNRSYGPSVGVFVNFNLFNGLRDYKNMKVNKIEMENARINSDRTTATNSALVLQAFRDYEVALRVMRLEQESEEKANENVNIALKRFELGNISSVEFRDVQLQSVEARSRLLTAQYAIRISELELKRLAGTLAL